jgi:hypothetical protein
MLLHHLQFDEDAPLHAASVCSDGTRQAAILESSAAVHGSKDDAGELVAPVGAAARHIQRRSLDTQMHGREGESEPVVSGFAEGVGAAAQHIQKADLLYADAQTHTQKGRDIDRSERRDKRRRVRRRYSGNSLCACDLCTATWWSDEWRKDVCNTAPVRSAPDGFSLVGTTVVGANVGVTAAHTIASPLTTDTRSAKVSRNVQPRTL